MGTVIEKTTDYSIFKTLEGNRTISKRRVEKAKKTISEIGYVMGCPIVVNEHYEIVEGQARFEALKEFNMPVPYVVQPGLGIKECRMLNTGTTNWTGDDYAYSFAKNGNPDYIRLAQLKEKYKLPIGTIVALVYKSINGDGGNHRNNLIKTGEFQLSKERAMQLDDALEWLGGFENLRKVKKCRSEVWLTCIYFVSEQDGVTRKELKSRINKYIDSLPESTRSPRTMLLWLSDIWNNKRPKGERRHFDRDYYEG